MLKPLVTLLRGHISIIGEAIADHNALVLLDQQMRDAACAVERAKKALAVATAEESREGKRLDAARCRIEDLELRAVAAIEAGRDELAAEAAEAIAALEAEYDASSSARAMFIAEIAKLKRHVLQQQTRLSQLERGRRIARAAEAVRLARRGRLEAAPLSEGSLAEAEDTLGRLRERQLEAEAADAALDELDAATTPTAIADKLAAQGFGPRAKPTAADVIARLKACAAPGKPTANLSTLLTGGAPQ